MRCRLRRLLYGTAILLVGVLLCELLLQMGAHVVRGQSRLVPAQWLTGHTRVLALGDSNTYGLYLKEEESWPAQLERAWNATHPTNLIEVLNLGYPGTNSFRVRSNMPALLNKLQPDIVLLMVGFNDFWTPAEITDDDILHLSWWQRVWMWVQKNSRIYRLYIIWERSQIGQQDLQFGSPRDITTLDLSNKEVHLLRTKDGDSFYMGTLAGDPTRNRQALPGNLRAMIAIAKQHNADVYLMTYPSDWGFYPGANKWIRAVAEQQGVPLIDITPMFVARCANGPASCADLLFHDGHATAQGNALVAEAVAKKLFAAQLSSQR